MHGFARIRPVGRRLKLWWSQGRGEPDPLAEPDWERPINLFPPTSRGQMFTAGGLFSEAGEIRDEDRRDLHLMMAALAERMAADNPDAREDNPDLPSGYAYLLQFIAHDMVDTVLSPSVARSVDAKANQLRIQLRNGRGTPLSLATLYGPGPDALPAAYEYDERQQLRRGHVPRTRFRLGPRIDGAPAGGFCPHRDIARGRTEPHLAEDRGLPARLRPPAGEEPRGRPYLTEALVADPRNDAHPLIAQLTVLFKLLHNRIVAIVEEEVARSPREQPPGDPDDERVEAYQQFQCARALTTIVYHGVIAHDLLPRFVDPRVLRRYAERDGAPYVEDLRGAPLEFSHGAFRFAHSVIRDVYRVNLAHPPQHMINGLSFSSSRRPDLLPSMASWMVDWSLFFDLGDGRLKNVSKRISPVYPRVLAHEDHFMAKDRSVDRAGVADRDLLSSSYAGLLSVRAIVEELSRRFDFIEPLETVTVGLRDWLTRPGPWSDRPGEPRSSYLDRIVADPPLPFFVLYEAQKARAPVPEAERRAGGPDMREIGGRHLGPVGSAIVCETLFAAMRLAAPVEGAAAQAAREGAGFDARSLADERMAVRCRACVGGFYADPSVVENIAARLPPISSMPQLIEFLKGAEAAAEEQRADPAARRNEEGDMHGLVTIDPSSEALWGKLVLSWALETSVIDNVPAEKIRRPTDRDELIEQCRTAGLKIAQRAGDVGVFIPPRIRKVACAQASLDTLILKLPEKELYAEAKNMLREGQPYPVPSFYITLFNPDGMTQEDMLKLQECRIGDYSMSHCV